MGVEKGGVPTKKKGIRFFFCAHALYKKRYSLIFCVHALYKISSSRLKWFSSFKTNKSSNGQVDR